MYELQYEKPRPLVPRRLRFEIPERTGPRGEEWAELDEGAVRAGGGACARRGRGGGRDQLPACLRRPWPRAPCGRDRPGGRRRRRLHHLLLRHPRRDPRVRAHEHGGRQCVRRPRRRALPPVARVEPGCCRDLGSAPDHAVQRRPDERHGRDPQAGAPGRIRPGRRRRRVCLSRASHRQPERDLARHGRHHGKGRDPRGRTAGQDVGVRGRSRHQPEQPPRQGRRPRDPAAVHRPLRDRGRRRQPGLRGRVRDAPRRARERRLGSGAGLLRPRRGGADADRCPGRPRLPEPRAPGRRRRGAGRRRRRAGARIRGASSGHEPDRGRLRRLPAGSRDDDASGQGGLDLPRAGSTRLRALRLRRQRPRRRRRNRARAADAPRPRAARTGRLQRGRVAPVGGRARVRADAAGPRRQRHAGAAAGRLSRARGAGTRRAGGRGRRVRCDRRLALRRHPLRRAGIRADAACRGRRSGPRPDRGGLRRRASPHVRSRLRRVDRHRQPEADGPGGRERRGRVRPAGRARGRRDARSGRAAPTSDRPTARSTCR